MSRLRPVGALAAYRLLLRAFPPAFRRTHGREMERFFLLQRLEDRYRGHPGGTLRLWWEVLADVVPSAWGLWMERLPGRRARRPLPSRRQPGRRRSAPVPHGPAPDGPSTAAAGAPPRQPPRRGDRRMTKLFHDLRFAARSLAKNPGFTAVAAITLALGVGANTAIFSVVHGVLLKPLAFSEPDRLFMIWHRALDGSSERDSVTPGNFADWREQSESFAEMAAYFTTTMNMTNPGEPERMEVGASLGSIFDVLGVPAAAGRTYTAAEDAPGAPEVAVLSHRAAVRLFGSPDAAIGASVTLSGQPRTVIGVMPASFRFPRAGVDAWLPSRFSEEFRANRTEYWLRVLGRLAPGRSLEEARAEMDTIAARLREEYPQANGEVGVRVAPLADEMVAEVEDRILLLMGAVALVLLIACVNLANLLLARGATRRREIAVREALGASRGRLVGQVLTESLLLATVGGALGLALGEMFLHSLLLLVPGDMPRLDEIAVSAPVAAFALAASFVSALLFGAFPALELTRRRAAPSLRHGIRTAAGGGWMRSGLVTAEVALSVVLLAGAGLVLRSFFLLHQVDPGFPHENLLTLRLALPHDEADPQRPAAFFQDLDRRLEALPGVVSAATVSELPLAGRGAGAWLNLVERPLPPDETPPIVLYRLASPDYFTTVGLPLLQGRHLERSDGAEGTAAVVINAAAARRFWPEGDALGQHLTLGPEGGWIPESEVVGIVSDARNLGLGEETPPVVYMPHRLLPAWGHMAVVLRTAGDPLQLAGPTRSAVRALDPTLPLYQMRTMEEVLNASVASTRSVLVLLGVFAAVAVALAAVGVFGVLSFSVNQRVREMGIRMALGADRKRLSALVVREGLTWVVLGLALGTAAALGLARLLGSLLYGVTASDPLTYAGVALVLLVAAALAGYLPARRATRVDPMEVLRVE